MKPCHFFCLILVTALVSSFQPGESSGAGRQGYNDSLINCRAKFIKNIQAPYCGYVWIKERDRFEINVFTNGNFQKKIIDVEYANCLLNDFEINHYYILVAKGSPGGNFYRNISTSFTPLDSMLRHVNEKFKTLDTSNKNPGIRE